MTKPFYSIILAAGSGTRMKSPYPKMLHKVAGKGMIMHILDTINSLNPKQNYVVYGYKGDVVQAACAHYDNITWTHQEQQLGTAHAVKCAADLLEEDLYTICMFSDNPLVKAETIAKLFEKLEKGSDLVLMTTVLDNPFGYGRVKKDESLNICAIVEEKDASEEERQIQEVFPGILACKAKNLQKLLAQVDNKNAQNEYYLTDIVALAHQAGMMVTSVATDSVEVSSANTKYQLAQLEEYYHSAKIKEMMEAGLILHSTNPSSITLRGDLEFGEDCDIDLNCSFNGKVVLGNRVKIGQGCILTNCTIGDDTVIEPYSIIEQAEVADNCAIGPYARLRPGSKILTKAKVGNFVETKNTVLGLASKANHLTYLGDCEVGADVNIGAGVITCNYDGKNKFKTIIGDQAFIGSDCQLVAPVKVAPGATVASGTTVLKDIDNASLVFNRKETVERTDWTRPKKIEKK